MSAGFSRILLGLCGLSLAACEPATGAPKVDSADETDTGQRETAEDSAETAESAEDSAEDSAEIEADPATLLCINEFMASNAFTITDESGLASDWIELYNPGSEAVVLSGMTLSDNFDEPDRHLLDEGLQIEGGGFLLLWADGTPELGAQHLSFGLSEEGEEIGLYLSTGAPVDLVRYGLLPTDESAARVPDASTTWEITNIPTPNASNGSAE